MTTKDIYVPVRLHPFMRMLIRQEMNVLESAKALFVAGDDTPEQQHVALNQGLDTLHDWILDNIDEVTTLMYKKFKLNYLVHLNEAMLAFNDQSMLSMFDKLNGTPTYVVAPTTNAPRNGGGLDMDDDIFSEFESPRAKLNAELDRLRARNGGENGHG